MIMKILELFSGTGSFSEIGRKMGCNIFRVDINPNCQTDLCKDILKLK